MLKNYFITVRNNVLENNILFFKNNVFRGDFEETTINGFTELNVIKILISTLLFVKV